MPKKCSQDGWCSAMDERLEPEANARRKGFVVIVVTSMDTWKQRVVGVAYKKSASDRGLMLNRCPWCGEPILWDGKQEDTTCTVGEKTN